MDLKNGTLDFVAFCVAVMVCTLVLMLVSVTPNREREII